MSRPPNDNGLAGLTALEAEAMDHALGALGRAERRAAQARLLSDPAYAAAVARWQALLAPLDEDTAPVTPPAGLWDAIAAEIAPPPAAAGAPAPAPAGGWWHNIGLWRALGLGGPVLAALAAALLVMPAAPPAGSPAPSVPALLATLKDGDGKPLLEAAYDPASGAVRFAPVAADAATAGTVPELWVIDGKNPPRSLGVIDIRGGAAHAIPAARLASLKPGAILAISIEPAGGSPTGAPTGPVIATGTLNAAG